MAHVITDPCTKCLTCTEVCPVSCIHPAEGEDGLDEAPQLYIDPEECIDCGACAPACPVEAIFPEEDLPEDKKRFADVNARFSR